jgi:hypothetical protein
MTGGKKGYMVLRELMGKMVEYARKHEKSRWEEISESKKRGTRSDQFRS